MSFSLRRAITVAVRIVAFTVTMAPLAVLFVPWITLDGGQARTGVTSIALLVSPVRDYIYAVDPVQAALVTIGPILIVLFSIVTSNSYYKRETIFWAPLAILVVALAIIFLTHNLVSYVHDGPRIVVTIAILLMLHQAAIRLQVATRRKRNLAWASGPLAVATGIEEHRRRR